MCACMSGCKAYPSCMPAMACGGGAARECFSSGSASNTGEAVPGPGEDQFRVPYHGKPFLSSPAAMGDLRHTAACAGNDEPNPLLPSTALPVPKKTKKKRSLPGTPDPSAEVIALSPTTLMATNRFVCEICHKGFQRDQNLQLHRRGHNLPWKLRQRGSGSGSGEGPGSLPRKRAYVCPEPSCVHHDPRRALGDLTGIKKHFSRKHGEKKWRCERCGKRYAVHSDWKAHSKLCGSREYRCHCGTLFSRRDSFVTHRAFCDALAQENNKMARPLSMATVASALQGQGGQGQQHGLLQPSAASDRTQDVGIDIDNNDTADGDGFGTDAKSPHLKMFSDTAAEDDDNPLGCMLSSLGGAAPYSPSPATMAGTKLSLLGLSGPSDSSMGFSPSGLASMSATALLQKAAQMGATTSSGYGVGLGSTMAGLACQPNPGPFEPMRPLGPYDGLPLRGAHVVGFDVGGLMPGQLYGDEAHDIGAMTRAVRSMTKRESQMEPRQAEEDGRVVDYMGVQNQTAFGGISPFAHHLDPWA